MSRRKVSPCRWFEQNLHCEHFSSPPLLFLTPFSVVVLHLYESPLLPSILLIFHTHFQTYFLFFPFSPPSLHPLFPPISSSTSLPSFILSFLFCSPCFSTFSFLRVRDVHVYAEGWTRGDSSDCHRQLFVGFGPLSWGSRRGGD